MIHTSTFWGKTLQSTIIGKAEVCKCSPQEFLSDSNSFDFTKLQKSREWRGSSDRHLPIYYALLWMTRFLDKWIGGTPRNWLTQKLGKPTWKMNLPSFSRWIAVLCTASPSSSTIRLKLLFHMKRKSLALRRDSRATTTTRCPLHFCGTTNETHEWMGLG